MKCAECGSTVAAGSGRSCPHCGALLPGAERVQPYEYMTHAERFDAVTQAPGYVEAMAHVPPVSATPAVVVGALFSFVALAMAVGGGMLLFGNHGQPAFGAVWMILCSLFVAVGIGIIVKGVRFASAPVERRVAVVVDERTAVSGGGQNSRASTRSFVALQFRDGRRTEFPCAGPTAGLVTRGDAGVAYFRLDKLVDFRRFQV